MNTILVTGGAGFVGSHVVDALISGGYEVSIFDTSADSCFNGARMLVADTRDLAAVSRAVAAHDGVIHLAGILGTQETISEPRVAVETNITGSLNIFEAAKQHGVPAVYITVGNYWMNNPYSITKRAAEQFALMFNKEYGTKIAVVRGLNAYGPRQKPYPVKKMMPNFLRSALAGEPITIYGNGSQVMDTIYVSDLADVIVRALILEHNVYDRIFEAGTGRRTTVQQIAEEVIRQVGSGSIMKVSMRPGEPENSIVIADPETLRPLFQGLRPTLTTLEQGIAKTIPWYRDHLTIV